MFQFIYHLRLCQTKTKIMKNKYILFSATAVLLIGIAAFSFAGKNEEDDKKKVKVEKKMEVSDENGNKTVNVSTTENGKTKNEVYTGKEADEYLKKNDTEIKTEKSFGENVNIKIETESDVTSGNSTKISKKIIIK